MRMGTQIFSILASLLAIYKMAGRRTEFVFRKSFTIGREHIDMTATGSFSLELPEGADEIHHFVFGTWALETLGEIAILKAADSKYYAEMAVPSDLTKPDSPKVPGYFLFEVALTHKDI